MKLIIISCLCALFASSNYSFAQFKSSDPLPANLFVELAKAINPTVVNISTTQLPKGRVRNADPLLLMMEQLWGQGAVPQNMRPQQSLGTGFIIRQDGLILTNNHVVEKADVIRIQLSEKDEKLYEAKFIGRDQRTDIALIKINVGRKLPVAKLGSSAEIEVGEWVAAFGNPYGHGHTMTKGIISAKNRDLGELNRFPFLQTDASINPGNSGGPLVNTKGEVIGVNTAIDARAQGIGFAIPIDDVKSILTDLEQRGKVKRPYLGIAMVNLNARAAKSLGLDSTDGVLVAEILPNSPADKAELHPYDVITKLGDKSVRNVTELQKIVEDTGAGKTTSLLVIRDGLKKTLSITFDVKADEAASAETQNAQYIGQKAPFDMGFKVSGINKKMIDEMGLNPSVLGRPIIIEVSEGKPALTAGLQPGDIILDVNRNTVKTPKDVLTKLQKGNNLIRIARGNVIAVIFIEGGKTN